MRAIDLSNRKTPYRVILVKIKKLEKITQKSENCHLLGHPVNGFFSVWRRVD
jgi:hypothetical protein